jgi:hypothetical protein
MDLFWEDVILFKKKISIIKFLYKFIRRDIKKHCSKSLISIRKIKGEKEIQCNSFDTHMLYRLSYQPSCFVLFKNFSRRSGGILLKILHICELQIINVHDPEGTSLSFLISVMTVAVKLFSPTGQHR